MRSLLACWVMSITMLVVCEACRSQANYIEMTRQANNNHAPEKAGGTMEIKQFKAISVAEDFIARNGYTESPPSADESEIVFESTDPSDRVLALAGRSNTLEPKSYMAMRRDQPSGWIVVFRYNAANIHLRSVVPNFDEYLKLYGRAVVMDLGGASIHIEHQDIALNSQ